MKKVLLLLLFIIGNFVYGQKDGYKLPAERYQEIKNNTTFVDSLSAHGFADKIAESAKTDFIFEDIYLRDDESLEITYRPVTLTEAQQKLADQYRCIGCMTVFFVKKYRGANKDLEIKGIPYFSFKKVSGKYLDIFPTWQREFLPGANMEETLTDHLQRTVKSISADVDIRLKESPDWWEIYNWL